MIMLMFNDVIRSIDEATSENENLVQQYLTWCRFGILRTYVVIQCIQDASVVLYHSNLINCDGLMYKVVLM